MEILLWEEVINWETREALRGEEILFECNLCYAIRELLRNCNIIV